MASLLNADIFTMSNKQTQPLTITVKRLLFLMSTSKSGLERRKAAVQLTERLYNNTSE